MAFGEINLRHHKFWRSVKFQKMYMQKPWHNNIICRLLQGLWLHTQRVEMEQILLANGLPKVTVAAIMMLYRNAKVKVHSLDGDTDYFDFVAGVLQGDTLAPYLFIICLDYMLRTSINKMNDNGSKLAKERTGDTPHEQLWMWTTPMTALWQIHPPKPKPCYIVWNEQLLAYASMSKQTRQNTCALIKEVTSPC